MTQELARDKLIEKVRDDERLLDAMVAAIDYQSEEADMDRWQEYPHVGFEVNDLGIHGWELSQLAGTGFITKSYSSSNKSYWRVGIDHGDGDDHDWELLHEEAKEVVTLAVEDETDQATSGDPDYPSMDAVDVKSLFTDVVGYEDEKKWFRRTINRGKQVHHLLVGQPGSGKSMMLDDILELPGAHRVVFSGNSSSAAGIRDLLVKEKPRFLVVEEIEKGDKSDREALMTLCGQGYVEVTKGDRGSEKVELGTTVFAAGNQSDKITPDSLVDRFMVWEFEQYDRDEFVEVCRGVLPREEDVDGDLSEFIAEELYDQYQNTSVRDALDIAGLSDDREDVRELVSLVAGDA